MRPANAEKILIIDDNQSLAQLIARVLSEEGYTTFTALDGEKGLETFHQIAPDLVILDIMMPKINGWEVCRQLRQTSLVPIIFLTAVDSKQSMVDSLVGGADDYLVKPFEAAELKARVVALLRRAQMPVTQIHIMRFGGGDLIINREEQIVFTSGSEVQLSPIEYNLLVFLAERAGQILSNEILFDAIWGDCPDTGPQSVKWYIWRLRQKIEEDPHQPRFILTERGKGYRFSPH